MAYGVKYRMEFTDSHNRFPAEWRIDIAFRDYTGTVTDISGGADPIVLTRGDQGSDKMVPVVGSEVQITIDNWQEKLNPEEFYVLDEKQVRVTIYKDGIVYWVGFCKSDFCEYGYSDPQFTINATDRIAILKNQLVNVDDAKVGDGYLYLLDLLKDNGLFSSDVSTTLKVISTLKWNSLPTTFGGMRVRYEALVDNDGNAINIYDSLTKLAASFAGRIFYSSNAFWFQRIEDLTDETLHIDQYDGSSNTPSDDYDISLRRVLKGDISSGDIVYMNLDHHITIQAPYKQAKLDLDYKFRGYLQNFNWLEFDGTDFEHWTRYNGAIVDQHGNGSADNPYVLYFAKNAAQGSVLFQEIPCTSNDVFTLKTTITFLKTTNTAIKFALRDTEGNLTALFDGAAWYAKPAGAVSLGDHFGQVYNRPEHDNKVEVSISLPPIPSYWITTSGEHQPAAIVVGIVDPDGTFNETSAYNGMEVSEIIFSNALYGYSGEIDTVRSNKEYSKQYDAKDILYIDAYGNVANAVFHEDVQTISNKSWRSKHDNTINSLLQWNTLRSIMDVNKKPFEIMEGTFFSNKIEFETIIQRAYGEYKLFMQLYDEYHIRTCEHRMTLAEIDTFSQPNATDYSQTQKYKYAD